MQHKWNIVHQVEQLARQIILIPQELTISQELFRRPLLQVMRLVDQRNLFNLHKLFPLLHILINY